MNNTYICEENYDKFIFKGSLALESYYDDTQNNKKSFDIFNKKLKEYRSLVKKNIKDKVYIVNELLSVFEQIVMESFIIYEDGDVEYNYNGEKGDELNVK